MMLTEFHPGVNPEFSEIAENSTQNRLEYAKKAAAQAVVKKFGLVRRPLSPHLAVVRKGQRGNCPASHAQR